LAAAAGQILRQGKGGNLEAEQRQSTDKRQGHRGGRMKKFFKWVGIFFAIGFVGCVAIVILTPSSRTPEQKIITKKEITKKREVSTQKVAKSNLIDYKIFRQWNIPAGGIGADILVSEKAKKEEVMVLAKALRRKYFKSNIFIFIFDSEEACKDRMRPEPKMNYDEYFKHFLATITVNKNSGYDEITWCAKNRDIDK